MSDFTTISQKWSPYWDDVSRTTLGRWPWRSRSQHHLEAKSCLAHNFVIWCRILQLFYRNDHHIKTCCMQHFGCYLEGQGYSTTWQENRVRPITSLFEVGFYNYFTEMINKLRQCVTHKSVDWSHWVEVQCKEQ
jgi:hypothetical protein